MHALNLVQIDKTCIRLSCKLWEWTCCRLLHGNLLHEQSRLSDLFFVTAKVAADPSGLRRSFRMSSEPYGYLPVWLQDLKKVEIGLENVYSDFAIHKLLLPFCNFSGSISRVCNTKRMVLTLKVSRNFSNFVSSIWKQVVWHLEVFGSNFPRSFSQTKTSLVRFFYIPKPWPLLLILNSLKKPGTTVHTKTLPITHAKELLHGWISKKLSDRVVCIA